MRVLVRPVLCQHGLVRVEIQSILEIVCQLKVNPPNPLKSI